MGARGKNMLLILLGIGCGSSVETHQEFATIYAESQCLSYKQCYRMLFDGEYDGMTDCEETVQTEFYEENLSFFDGCSYNASAAEECIQDLNQSSCAELWTNKEDIYKACHSDVWTCAE